MIGLSFSPTTSASLINNISLAILRLQQTGVIESIWKRTILDLQADCSASSAANSISVTLTQLQGLWYVLLIGLGLSLVVLAFERVFVALYMRAQAKRTADFLHNNRLSRRASTMIVGFLGGADDEDDGHGPIDRHDDGAGNAPPHGKRRRPKSMVNLGDLVNQQSRAVDAVEKLQQEHGKPQEQMEI